MIRSFHYLDINSWDVFFSGTESISTCTMWRKLNGLALNSYVVLGKRKNKDSCASSSQDWHSNKRPFVRTPKFNIAPLSHLCPNACFWTVGQSRGTRKGKTFRWGEHAAARQKGPWPQTFGPLLWGVSPNNCRAQNSVLNHILVYAEEDTTRKCLKLRFSFNVTH